MNIDTLIHPRWIITVNPHNDILEHYSIAIKDGRIIELLETALAKQKYSSQTEYDLHDHAVIPGLINCHGHSAMTLLRGIADDIPLMDWLNQHIWPAEHNWVNAEFVQTGTQLACAEMIRSGTTCFNDMYFFPEETASAVELAGIRATVGLIVINFPSAYAQDANEYFTKGLLLHDKLRHHSLIKTAFAPHSTYTVADESLRRIATLAEELDIPVQIHLHETLSEVTDAEKNNGIRPFETLKQLGLLNPRLLAVHMTQLNRQEIHDAAAHGIHIVHCPESNLKLASGCCSVQQLLDNGVNVALGTDGAASNNDLDMLGEMRSAALLAKMFAADASAVSAQQVLRMATINGAKALSMEHEIGSIEHGKSADLVAINLNAIETQPVYHPLSQIVYAASREQIEHVWVAGNQLLKNRVLTTLDQSALIAAAKRWQQKISARQ